MDQRFRGHYDEWTRNRIAYIEDRFGPSWFRNKRILELGCGHAHIGRHFARLGATLVCVDARQEHLDVVRRLDPGILTVCADLNRQWPIQGRFDLILHLGVLYHLEDFRFSLEKSLQHSDRIVLETEVLDSLSSEVMLPIDENHELYDQSFTGRGIRPSAASLERIFDQHGFYAFRLASNVCNSKGDGLKHIYDWACQATNTWKHGQRRLWVLQSKASMPPCTPENISVVVQGPIVGLNDPKPRKRITQQCIANLRRHLRGAEIILSTWKGSPTTGLDYDLLIENEDPGGICCDDVFQVYNNANRQIVSTISGIKSSRRPYCLKIRSDLILGSRRFLKYWARFPKRNCSYRFTAERMLSSSVYARQYAGQPGRTTRIPFHPSDFLFFGFTHDLFNLFDIPLTEEPETSRWFETYPRPDGVHDCFAHSHCRFFPEQHIWISFLRKFLNISPRDRLDLENPSLIHDRASRVNNLVVLDQAQWRFQMPKYRLKQYSLPHTDWNGIYSHAVWRREYADLCGGAPQRGVTYDTAMRYIFHDSHIARRVQRHAPGLFAYVHKRLRKQRLFP